LAPVQNDLFHDQAPDDYIVRVFATMAANYCWDRPTHTFQVLTKRHARMRSLLSSDEFRGNVARTAAGMTDSGHADIVYDAIYHHHWPLPNVWLGVSTENQQWADIRIPALLETPAAVRWISAEPLLGPIDLDPLRCPYGCGKQNEHFDESTHTWRCIDCVNDGAVAGG
jgi:protein gp37